VGKKNKTPLSKKEYEMDLERLNIGLRGWKMQDYTNDTFSIKSYGLWGPTAGLAGLFQPGPSIKQT
jgi:hypothetical protein